MTDPTNQTTLKKQRFVEEFFNKAGNISELCKAVGIHRSTYYEWMNKDERFNAKINAEREGLIDFAESKLIKLIDEKNVTAIIFFLKTRAKDRGYVEKVETEHSGGVDVTLKKIITDVRPE